MVQLFKRNKTKHHPTELSIKSEYLHSMTISVSLKYNLTEISTTLVFAEEKLARLTFFYQNDIFIFLKHKVIIKSVGKGILNMITTASVITMTILPFDWKLLVICHATYKIYLSWFSNEVLMPRESRFSPISEGLTYVKISSFVGFTRNTVHHESNYDRCTSIDEDEKL